MPNLSKLAFEAHRPELLVLVRHGESVINVVKKNSRFLPADESAAIMRGVPDHRIPLTTRGARQAELTSFYLRRHIGEFHVAYDSGYLRTAQTRAGLLSTYAPEELERMKLRTSHLIHERLSGYAYDMTEAQMTEHFPWFQAHWEMFGPFYATPPGGESQETVCDRVYRFNGLLFEQRRGQKVLVATHGGTLRAFRFNLEHWSAEEYMRRYMEDPPKNCGVTVYRFSPRTGRLELEMYNQTYWKEEDLVGL
jgi:2,3-bisphosphoglycerate-dependent phosphoglycerate mutase